MTLLALRALRLGALRRRVLVVAVLLEDEADALADACREEKANGRAIDDALALAERLLALGGHFREFPLDPE